VSSTTGTASGAGVPEAEAEARKAGADIAGRDDDRSRLRRRDRGKDDAWVRAFLTRAPWGYLATVGDDGQPYLNSNLFVFDEARHEFESAAQSPITRATFSEPGEYILRLEAQDETGPGGGGSQCCWTSAQVRVRVKAAEAATGQ